MLPDDPWRGVLMLQGAGFGLPLGNASKCRLSWATLVLIPVDRHHVEINMERCALQKFDGFVGSVLLCRGVSLALLVFSVAVNESCRIACCSNRPKPPRMLRL